MGPVIILDKSTLQSLSPAEVFILNKFYYIHITPVLLIEILGDLKKPSKKGLSEDRVMHLANKILPSDSAISAHYMNLLVSSLFGYPVKMERRPNLVGGIPVRSESGESGVIFDVSPEEKVLNNWKDGNFTEAENLLSEQWRESTRALDLESFKKAAKRKIRTPKSLSNIEELNQYVSRLLTQERLQTGLLRWLVEEYRLELDVAQRIFLRWEQSKEKLIRDFSPYAYYCFHVLTLFYFGLIFDLIGTRATNKVDLEYIYYLPFCMVFVSNDKFHKSIIGPFLNSDQVFVSGEDLKKDLEYLLNEWNTLRYPKGRTWQAKHGYGPPDNSNCLTFLLWKKFLPGWQPGRKVKETKSSPQDEAELVERMKRLENAPVDNSAWQSLSDDSKVDFIIRKREVSINDPCPCGSGKRFKECHWPEIRRGEEQSS